MSQILLEDEDKIKIIIKNIEKNPTQNVLGYDEFDINTGIYSVDFNVSGYRDLEILEMGILKFLSLKFESLENSISGISNIMEIDEVFLKDPIKKLQDAKLIESDNNSNLKITNKGTKFFLERRAPIPPTENTVKLIYNGFTEEILPFIEVDQDEVLGECLKESSILDLNFLNNYKASKIKIPKVEEKDIERILKSFKIKNTYKTQKISDVSNIKFIEERSNRYLIFYVYDHLDKKIYLRVWDYMAEKFSNEIQEILRLKANYNIEEKLENHIQLRAIESPVISQIEAKYSESLQTLVSKEKNNKKEIKETEYNQLLIKQIRNEKIKPEFNKILRQTKKLIIISTPWISEKVVNPQMIDQFKSILNRGGKIVISWGYADRFDLEEKLPPKELMNNLNSLKSKDGSDGILLVWIGNKHNKEIISDNNVHMLGSFNWLSYRGEFNIRGESVYKVEEKNMVKEATKFLEESILEALNKKISLDKLDILMRFESKEKVEKIFEENIQRYLDENLEELINFMRRLINKYVEFKMYFEIFSKKLSQIRVETESENLKNLLEDIKNLKNK